MIINKLKLVATVSVDFYANNIKTINVKQCDTNTRFIHVFFTEHGKKVGLNQSTMSVIARYKKPDGKFGYRDGKILDDGSALIELTEQMTVVSGKTQMDVVILEESGIKADSFADITSFEEYGVAILSAMPLILNVISTPIQDAELESQYDFTAFTNSLAAAKAAEADMIAKNSEWAEAERQRDMAETSRTEAEIQREQNVSDLINDCQNKIDVAIEEFENDVDKAILDFEGKSKEAIAETNSAASNANSAATYAIDVAATANTAALNANNAATYANSEAKKCWQEYESISADAVLVIEGCETARDRANLAAQECKDIVSGSGIIMQSEKGVAGGIPVLGDDCKVPLDMLPEIENYGVGGDKLGLVKNGGNVTINSDGTMTAPALTIDGDIQFIQPDWDATSALEGAIKNKPPIKKGEGKNSIVSSGVNNQAFGEGSHAEGQNTTVEEKGIYAHAEGCNTSVSSHYAHAEGVDSEADGYASHTEGYKTKTDFEASYAHTEGYYTKAFDVYSHTEGHHTEAHKAGSHAEGHGSQTKGMFSHAEGFYTIALGDFTHVQGKYNTVDESKVYAHIIGNGKGDSTNLRSNAHTVDWDGKGSFAKEVASNGADYAEFFEWQDGNLDNEDRVGYLVTLDGDKIKFANQGDEILGIISGTVAVLGDNYEWEWNGKYITDDFGRIQYELVEEFVEVLDYIDEETKEPIMKQESIGFVKQPKINPDYDPEQKYLNRSNRPEWATVGMFGKLYVRDDGTCQVNGYATIRENGIATNSDGKTNMRVLSRVNGNVIRVLLK